jgi:hypothetical protein
MINVIQIMEYLYDHRVKNLPPDALAEVFDRLIWCLDNSGSDVIRTIEEWLQSPDRERVEIALSMREVFPFLTTEQMVQVFSTISSRWPDLGPRCSEIGEQRKQQSKLDK